MHPIFQSNPETAQLMEMTAPSRFSRAGDRPIESGTPVGTVADSQAEMSRPPDHAEEIMDTVETWKSATHFIKGDGHYQSNRQRNIPSTFFLYDSLS
jgi:hypothetical protein